MLMSNDSIKQQSSYCSSNFNEYKVKNQLFYNFLFFFHVLNEFLIAIRFTALILMNFSFRFGIWFTIRPFFSFKSKCDRIEQWREDKNIYTRSVSVVMYIFSILKSIHFLTFHTIRFERS